MRLAELQAVVHATLRHERGLDEAAAALGVPSRRLTIYRDFVTGHMTRVLAKVYPYTRALLPTAVWDRLAFAFYRAVPPAERELNACAAPFPAWLDQEVGSDVPACLPTLAQVEWELFAAFASTTDVPTSSDGPLLNPSITALETRWAIVPWLVLHPSPAAVTPATPLPNEHSQTALIFRRATTHAIAFHVASDDLLFAIKVVSEAITPSDAAALMGVALEVVQAALRHAVDIGLVIQGPPEIQR